MDISLREITDENQTQAASIECRHDQKSFVADGFEILALASVGKAENVRCSAIYHGENIVGLMLVEELNEEPCCYHLHEMLIDKRHQHLGYGTSALNQLLEALATEGKYPLVEVCVHEKNRNAIAFFEKNGFTGSSYVDESCLWNKMYIYPLDRAVVCPAKPEDIPAMSLIHKKAWGKAYEGLLPKSYLSRIPDTHWVSLFERQLANPKVKAWISKVNNVPVACAFVCPSRYEEYEHDLEMESIYCLPEYWGRGIGSVLFRQVKSYATANEFPRIGLWVLQGNERAIRFYEHFGFYRDGSLMKGNIGGQEVTELRFILQLGTCTRDNERPGSLK